MDDYDSDDSDNSIDEKLLGASVNNDIVLIKYYLIVKDANPNIFDGYGITPLIYAAMEEDDNTDILELLLDNDAKINERDNSEFGNTALMTAALYNFNNSKYLLERGADPFLVNKKGNTAYDNAIQSDNMEIAQLIQDHIKLLEDNIDTYDEPSDPNIDLLKDEAARYIQTIMRARIETDKKRKFTKRRYGKWSSPETEREKDRRYMDLIRQIDDDDSMRGYERYSIYPERLLPPKKGGKRTKKKRNYRFY
tara:strand:+ start:91 stop:843 length:753 start_codon:yes stop_codon:yes gene_type:complete